MDLPLVNNTESIRHMYKLTMQSKRKTNFVNSSKNNRNSEISFHKSAGNKQNAKVDTMLSYTDESTKPNNRKAKSGNDDKEEIKLPPKKIKTLEVNQLNKKNCKKVMTADFEMDFNEKKKDIKRVSIAKLDLINEDKKIAKQNVRGKSKSNPVTPQSIKKTSKVWNIRPGPALGSRLWANTNANIVRPARMPTMVSAIAI